MVSWARNVSNLSVNMAAPCWPSSCNTGMKVTSARLGNLAKQAARARVISALPSP